MEHNFGGILNPKNLVALKEEVEDKATRQKKYLRSSITQIVSLNLRRVRRELWTLCASGSGT